MHEPVFPRWWCLLKEPEGRLRQQTIEVLEHLNPAVRKAAVPALTALKDKDAGFRIQALQLLAKFGESGSVDMTTVTRVLVDGLKDPRSQIRLQAVLRGIPGAKANDAVPELVRLVKDPDQEVWNRTVRVLRQLTSEETKTAVPRLIELSHDKEAFFRMRTAQLLREIPRLEAKAVIPALVEALRDPQLSVRVQAAWTLCQISSPAGDKELRKPAEMARAVLTALRNDADPSARLEAAQARAVGRHGGQSGYADARRAVRQPATRSSFPSCDDPHANGRRGEKSHRPGIG